jgi:DNA invertase Pin-like site-specific DNA recombinase
VLVVYKLDRLGRTMRGLVELVADLAQRKIEFRSLNDGIDTTTTMGRFTFHLLGAIAEMERDLIRERTNAGLAAARARGRKGGRKTILTATKLDAARALLQDRNRSVGEVAKTSLASGAPRSTARSAGIEPPGRRVGRSTDQHFKIHRKIGRGSPAPFKPGLAYDSARMGPPARGGRRRTPGARRLREGHRS